MSISSNFLGLRKYASVAYKTVLINREGNCHYQDTFYFKVNVASFSVAFIVSILVATTSLLIIIGYILFRLPSKEKRYHLDLLLCKEELAKFISKSNSNPLMLRLAWSDAVTYDSGIREWPYCGGVNGSIRLDSELNRAPNAGLQKAIALLTPIKTRFPNISWADLIQMAAVVAIKEAGGPQIDLIYGRIDVSSELLDLEKITKAAANTHELRTISSIAFKHAMCPVYPSAVPPYPDGAPSADVHLRNVFYRMGLNNREAVALCGGHTLGRAFKDRTGVCAFSSGDQGATLYTQPTAIAKVSNFFVYSVSATVSVFINAPYSRFYQANGQAGIGMAGGKRLALSISFV